MTAVRDNIRERKTAPESYRKPTATWPFRHLCKGCLKTKALPALGWLSIVSHGLLRPFQLDFSQIMAKIRLFEITKTVDRALLYEEVTSMPVYEFECSCGEVTEELTKMDTRSITCPKCGKKARKIISACSFELKGGGWYADGYASKKSGSSSDSTK